MTGWRIGYAAGPKDPLTAMANIQSQSTPHPLFHLTKRLPSWLYAKVARLQLRWWLSSIGGGA
jgi:hypothetical protein